MISKHYSKMALIALAAASLTFSACGGKNADSDLSKPSQEVYYKSDDGTFHKVTKKQSSKQQSSQAAGGNHVLYYKDKQGNFRKKTVGSSQSHTDKGGSSANGGNDVTGQNNQGTRAAVDLVAKPSIDSVSFAFNSSYIDKAGKEILADYASWLRANPDVSITIEGHCDERGSTEYNLALGDDRANGVRKVLVANGVAAHRVDTVSFGEDRPLCKVSTEACWRENRRGDISNR